MPFTWRQAISCPSRDNGKWKLDNRKVLMTEVDYPLELESMGNKYSSILQTSWKPSLR
jgi:hypothetical protein